ncbi:MAG TPA: glycosyltransferase family 39 protein [Burkholderiales bacterium]|nr:glycosyltransferase family 39 protein [Burkholderiales bacterium]
MILAFKLWLSAALPLTGDEAYFFYWGIYPDFGYYDHPPMIGWLLYLVHGVSNAPWVLRLPVTLLPFALAAGVYLVLRRADEEKAALAALAFMLLPANVWAVLITTDTPLIFFTSASVLAFWLGVTRKAPAWQALAGVFLGLAFLSKYFAVLLGLAYVVYTACSPRGRRDWRGLALVVACSLPFAMVNLWWNYEHCWGNLMFNAYNRNAGTGAGWSWKTPLLYAVSVLYVLSPVALWQLAKGRESVRAKLADPGARFFAFMVGFPFAFFAALSLVKQIGVHWLLGFVPFFFVLSGWLLSREQLRRSVVYLGAFSALHVAAIAAGAALPLETWKSARAYGGIVYHVRIHDILRELKPYEGRYELAADGYSPAVTASYYSGRYFFVFGKGSSYARQDDILTDLRTLDGKDILILRKDPPEDPDYRPYFKSVEYREFTIAGATFHLVLGRGFDFAAYREGVLKPVRDRLYAIPSYLPQGRCYFCERYFGAPTCPPRK